MRRKDVIRSKTDDLDSIFKKILYEPEIWVSVYDLNEEISDLSELETLTKVAKLNILSRDILAYDEKLLQENTEQQDRNSPRMYFFSYIIYMDSKFDKAAYLHLKEMKDNWYLASFLKESPGTEY